MLNTKEHFEQLETTLAVKELDDEAAAAIQGGWDLQVYRHANLVDKLGSFNFGKSRLSSNADDQITSFRINAGRWRFYTGANYTGRFFTWDKKGDWNVAASFNDVISSIRRV